MIRFKTLWHNLGPRRTIQLGIVCAALIAISSIVAWHGQMGSPILLFPAMFALVWVWRERMVAKAELVSKCMPFVWVALIAAVFLLKGRTSSTPWAPYVLFSIAGLYMAVIWTVYSDPRIVTERRLRA